jgi:type IV fimbrial biogenesis protein FimT
MPLRRAHAIRRRRSAGFTLVELVVVLAIVAIAMALALPNFREFLRRSRTSAVTNDLVASLAQARAEAVKRGVFVAVVARSGGSDWSTGWDVRADPARDSTFTAVVASHDPLTDGTSVLAGSASGGSARIVFGTQGDLVGNTEFHINVCRPDHDTAQSRRIRVQPSGEFSATRGTSQSSAPAC